MDDGWREMKVGGDLEVPASKSENPISRKPAADHAFLLAVEVRRPAAQLPP